MDACKFSTYGYACGKPVEHGRYLCEEHAKAKCSSCGQPATHGCDFCGQFVCGAPLCDECTYGTDESKSAGSWGFMNHIHVSKPEFVDKHENARLKAALAAKDAELSRLREENEQLSSFVKSFHLTCVESSFYKDCYLHIHEPDSVSFRLGNGSQFSKFIGALEKRRLTALNETQEGE